MPPPPLPPPSSALARPTSPAAVEALLRAKDAELADLRREAAELRARLLHVAAAVDACASSAPDDPLLALGAELQGEEEEQGGGRGQASAGGGAGR